MHLLVSPEDPQHLDEIGRFLARLTFSAHGDSFNCRPDDLMRLGRKADPAIDDETAALRRGAEQFKVSFDQLREKYRESQWAKENVLIAVAGAKDDGTSGLREGSDQTLRQQVERFAHIIFASSPAQRDYWLGRKTSPKDIVDRYDSSKPCLHGSDGHSLDRTGNPDGARYSWIKGSPIFDALRQACIDPEGRAYVGEEPPLGAAPSELISSILMAGTPWAKTRNIALNPGLVAIIGARGSGKTALADIIAAGCDAHGATMPKKAFLARAREHLAGARVRLAWQTGESEVRKLDGSNLVRDDSYPRARYLTQQFVDELCAADGMTDGLLSEVERVIFESHPVSERDGAVNFADLREMRGERHRQARKREEQGLAHLSERISSEIEKTKLVDGYANQIKDKLALIGQLDWRSLHAGCQGQRREGGQTG